MSELIRKDDVIATLSRISGIGNRALDKIKALPAVETDRTGQWINGEDTGEKMYECSECKCRMIARWYDLAVGTNGKRYCPYCGAKMEEKK